MREGEVRVCEQLSGIRARLTGIVSVFDGALLSGDAAAVVVEHAAGIENAAAALKALAAARVAETGVWRAAGDRTAAHYLARTSGSSLGDATEALRTARRIDDLPHVAAATRSGSMSPSQAAAIADAATARPEAEAELVEAARSSSLGELRDTCARTKAAADDPEVRRVRNHNRRCLRTYTDPEGMFHLHFRNNPEVGAEIMATLSPIRDRLFNAARAEGRREPLEAYAADALVELVRGDGETNARAPAKVIARVDLTTLLRGYPVEDEVCELVGFGPVAVSAVRDLMDTGDPFLAAVVTKGREIVGVAHLGRRPTAHQRTALEWLYPTCAADGCSSVAYLEFDHRVDWAKTHMTVFDLLDRLCSHHHRLKTRDRWGLVDGRGKRAFVPPDDPRHPGEGRAPPDSATRAA